MYAANRMNPVCSRSRGRIRTISAGGGGSVPVRSAIVVRSDSIAALVSLLLRSDRGSAARWR